MDMLLNSYLKSLIPNWNFNDNPLDKIKAIYDKELSFDYLANKIVFDMSQVSFKNANHRNELICQISKLNTLIKAYNFIEMAARNKGVSDKTLDRLKEKEFTEYKSSLRRLGLENEQLEDLSYELQKLSMNNVPKENIYELQIGKMVTLVKAYVDINKIDINSRDENGYTQFYIAVLSGDLEEVKMLLLLGCDPSIPDYEERTPFYNACSKGLTEIVGILIKREDVDPNVTCGGLSALCVACTHGFDEIVSIIVNSKRADLNSKYEGRTLLYYAISGGNKKCASILIKAGVDINAQDEDGDTLFHLFIRCNESEKAKMLLKLGCDPTILNFAGFTPFYNACIMGMIEIVGILIKREDVDPNITCRNCPPIFTACDNGFDEIVSIIAKSERADLNAKYNGKTPLHIAIDKGHKKSASILIAAGVDINEQNEFGQTLFHYFVSNVDTEKAKILLSLDCDPNMLDFAGFSSFYNACNKGMTEIVGILIERGDVDPDITCENCPPIFTACDNGFDEIVSIIAKSERADLNAKYNGKTPLHIAIDGGHKKCASILIAAGVNVNAQNEFGDTLFHIFIRRNEPEKAKILLTLDCDPNIPDFEGFTPFYTACCVRLTEIVNILIEREDVNPNTKCQNCPPIYTACAQRFDEIVSILARSNRVDLSAMHDGNTPLIISIAKGNTECVKALVEGGVDLTVNANCDHDPLLLACEYGMVEIVRIIAERMHIDINIRQLDLYNIAIVCIREKIDLEGHFFPNNEYSYESFNSVLKNLNEQEEQVFRKNLLDFLCCFVFKTLKNGTLEEFKKFLYLCGKFHDSTTEHVIDFITSNVNEHFVNIIERYNQILQVEIEEAGNFKKIEKLKLAYLLEIEIPKIGYAAHQVFSQKNGEYPRTIIMERGGGRLFILAKKHFSIIRGDGGFKDVKSALLVPSNISQRVERVVYAKIKMKTKASALEALQEYNLIKSFSDYPWFGKTYKFFSFDKNGNYISKQTLSHVEEQEVRSAIVVEEMDCDLYKVVKELSLNEQISVAKQLVEALFAMIREGRVSWDMKLKNVLIRRNIQLEQIKVAITDLGLVRDINQDLVKKELLYGSPWNGPPELLYATDVVDDANGHIKSEIWATGLVLYNMFFKYIFPLIDLNFCNNYSKYEHLPVVGQIIHYKMTYAEYVYYHENLVEIPLKELLLLSKEDRTPMQNLEILTYRMLQLDRNVRISPAEALDFCRDTFNI